MKAANIFIGLITLVITLPLSVVQSYLLLVQVHATQLMWFLFWFNLPIILLTSIISTIVSKSLIEKK